MFERMLNCNENKKDTRGYKLALPVRCVKDLKVSGGIDDFEYDEL